MATTKLSQIAAAGAISGTDTIVGVQAGTTDVQYTWANAATEVASLLGLSIDSGKTFTVSNTITLAGTDGTTFTFPGTSDTVVTLAATQTLTNKTVSAVGILSTSSVGSATAPTLVVGNATTGFFSVSTTGIGIAVNGVEQADFGISSAGVWRFANTIQCAGNVTGTSNSSVFSTRNGGTILSSPAIAAWQLGATDAATATAQTLRVQSVVAGTSNIAGALTTIVGSLSTGSGTSGDIVFSTGGTGAGAAVQNSAVIALTLKGASQSVAAGSASITTNATGGFLYIPAAAGTPTGTPSAISGFVPIYLDTTNSQLWLYLGGAWKQPKTPAGAALVTWQ